MLASTCWRSACSICAAGPASAFMAYVSNEKSNTISVIDTDKWQVVRTIKVGQRPRGIDDHEGPEIRPCRGRRRRHDRDHRHERPSEIVGTLPSGPDPELFVQDAAGKILYVANENDNTVTIIDIDKRERVGDVPVGVEPEGMAIEPGRQDPGEHVGNDEHGALHRHGDAGRSSPTSWSMHARATPNSSRMARSFGYHPRSAEPSA